MNFFFYINSSTSSNHNHSFSKLLFFFLSLIQVLKLQWGVSQLLAWGWWWSCSWWWLLLHPMQREWYSVTRYTGNFHLASTLQLDRVRWQENAAMELRHCIPLLRLLLIAKAFASVSNKLAAAAALVLIPAIFKASPANVALTYLTRFPPIWTAQRTYLFYVNYLISIL